MLLTNSLTSVPHFLVNSGILTAYVFLQQTNRAGGIGLKAMVLYYTHRFWRSVLILRRGVLCFCSCLFLCSLDHNSPCVTQLPKSKPKRTTRTTVTTVQHHCYLYHLHYHHHNSDTTPVTAVTAATATATLKT